MVVVGDAEERKQESEKGRKKRNRGYVSFGLINAEQRTCDVERRGCRGRE